MARLKSLGFFALILVVAGWIINAYIVVKTRDRIFPDASNIPAVEAVIVPGASVYRSGKLSPVLRQRMEAAVRFLEAHKGVKLVLSGHAIPHGYNETVAMEEYARKNAILPEDILVDEKGRSTYVTLLNCRRQFPFRRVLIVSQDYYLPRALYIAHGLGMEAWGLVVTDTPSNGPPFREYFVRIKDFILLRISKYFNAD